LYRCRQPAEKSPRQSRVVDEDNPLSFGNHGGYIANHSAAYNELDRQRKKAAVAAPFARFAG
jgi:hypothetical protein